MNRLNRLPVDVDIISQLSDLKEIDYKNMLILTALIDLLIEKGLITQQEMLDKTNKLESELDNSILPQEFL
ncbi:hypothetical protein [Vulcanibacillus modesticaldus]|uniref:hypothetical protein n=1 Tax=Vulcanibacillus modesticaldus TaxID=337097 RepID=UPI001FE10394|nr:hypothetical protein [Vulcanibacillus modesticaldus]